MFKNLHLKVGLFVIAVLVLAIGFVAYLLDARGFFEQRTHLELAAASADGISPGMPITFSGMPIGQVTSVNLNEAGGIVIKLAGQPCQLLVTHTARDGKTYANIENILAPLDRKAAATEVLVYSLDAPEKNRGQVPSWLLEPIDGRLADNWAEFNDLTSASAPPPEHNEPSGSSFSDDIPF